MSVNYKLLYEDVDYFPVEELRSIAIKIKDHVQEVESREESILESIADALCIHADGIVLLESMFNEIVQQEALGINDYQ